MEVRSTAAEILEVVDRHNRPVGRARRDSIHRYGLQHRSVHILVFDLSGRLYVQLRAPGKDQFPRHWDTSAAGHVSPGESYAAAAARELSEELAIRAELFPVAQVPACVETGWEHVGLFRCHTDLRPQPDPTEIEAGRFFTPQELQDFLADPTVAVTPVFRLLYRLWQAHRAEAFNPGVPPTCG